MVATPRLKCCPPSWKYGFCPLGSLSRQLAPESPVPEGGARAACDDRRSARRAGGGPKSRTPYGPRHPGGTTGGEATSKASCGRVFCLSSLLDLALAWVDEPSKMTPTERTEALGVREPPHSSSTWGAQSGWQTMTAVLVHRRLTLTKQEGVELLVGRRPRTTGRRPALELPVLATGWHGMPATKVGEPLPPAQETEKEMATAEAT